MPRHRDFLSPLNLAAYLTWAAIVSLPVLELASGRRVPDALALAGLAGVVAVLLLLLACTALEDVALRRWLTLAQLPAALLAATAYREGLQPVLLVLIATQASMLWPTRSVLAILAVANAALLALLLHQRGVVAALVSTAAYVGFQLFAVLTTRALGDAQDARDAAQRINAELLATRAMLAEAARGEERLHLSRELHDVAGHKLTALKLQLAVCEAGGAGSAVALASSRQLADELLADVRGVVGALRAHDGVDLHAALTALSQGIPTPPITLVLADDAKPPDLARAQALLRVAQEGVTNALRHAGARQIAVRLRRDTDRLVLTVEDDGRGAAGTREGNGLHGLRERLAAVGGALALESRPGGGTVLAATVPA